MPKPFRRQSLRAVVLRAFRNEKFYKDVMKNAENALKKSRISLSKKEKSKLKRIFGARSFAADFRKLKKLGIKFRKDMGFLPW